MNMFQDSYILKCRENYFQGITPSAPGSKQLDGYRDLAAIARNYIDESLEVFTGNFQEGQYLISLWTAHFILEYGHPDEGLKKKCLDVISDYARNRLRIDIAAEEAAWLDKYAKLL